MDVVERGLPDCVLVAICVCQCILTADDDLHMLLSLRQLLDLHLRPCTYLLSPFYFLSLDTSLFRLTLSAGRTTAIAELVMLVQSVTGCLNAAAHL